MTPNLHLFELVDASASGIQSYSPFCLKVNRALIARGLPYERHHLARPNAHDLTPMRQVPVLVIGDPKSAEREILPDSTAILKRIETLSGEPLVPADPKARAEAWLYEELADTALNGFLIASRWADDRNWPTVRHTYVGGAPWPVRTFIAPRQRAKVIATLVARDVWRAGPDACWSRFQHVLDQLDARAPADGFWVGDALSVADLGIFAQLGSLRTLLTPWQRDRLAERNDLSRYLDRVDVATTRA
jgi:glutathione S-transferase